MYLACSIGMVVAEAEPTAMTPITAKLNTSIFATEINPLTFLSLGDRCAASAIRTSLQESTYWRLFLDVRQEALYKPPSPAERVQGLLPEDDQHESSQED